MKKALTMIELIVVIVILGILSAGSMNVFMQVYNNYNITKRITYLESRTSSIIDTLDAKLRKRFSESLRYRCSNTDNRVKYLRDVKIGENICGGGEPRVLEWVMNYDRKIIDTKNGVKSKFCFSGVVDMKKTISMYTDIGKSGASMDVGGNITRNQIHIYDVDGISMDGFCFVENEKVGVYFLDTIYNKDFIEEVLLTGIIKKDGSLQIDKTDNKVASINISTAYQMAKTAQAISLEPMDAKNYPGLYNMYLYYDYQPWDKNAIKASGEPFTLDELTKATTTKQAKKVLLAEYVSQFRTIQHGDSVGIDICIDDPNYKIKDESGNLKPLRICKVGGAI